MKNIIVTIIILGIISLATSYIIRQKKKGVKCIGCPSAKECTNKCSCKR